MSGPVLGISGLTDCLLSARGRIVGEIGAGATSLIVAVTSELRLRKVDVRIVTPDSESGRLEFFGDDPGVEVLSADVLGEGSSLGACREGVVTFVDDPNAVNGYVVGASNGLTTVHYCQDYCSPSCRYDDSSVRGERPSDVQSVVLHLDGWSRRVEGKGTGTLLTATGTFRFSVDLIDREFAGRINADRISDALGELNDQVERLVRPEPEDPFDA